MLRFEHFKFVHMSMTQWNKSIVTPMRLVHTLTPEPDARIKKQNLQTASASMTLCDGISKTDSGNASRVAHRAMKVCRSTRAQITLFGGNCICDGKRC